MNKVSSKDGTAIAYDRTGRGPAVVIVGGAMSYRSFPGFVKLADLLADDFTLINYDRRGRGDSGDTKPYAVEREVEDLEAVIGTAGGSAHVWGMSSGGALALAAAAAGLAIEKLALWEPPFVADQGGRRPPADHGVRLKEMIATGRRDDAVRFFLRNMGVPAVMVAVMRWMPFWSRFRAVANTLPYDAAVMGDYSLPAERIASVAVPTLVIGGEKSDERLRHAVRATADALPNGRHRMLEGQNHNVSMEALAPVLAEYFKASDGTRTGTPSAT